jgi:23S rRNA A2030 N6-methylase RlmJ
MLKLSIHHGVVKLLDYFEMKEKMYLVLDQHRGGNLQKFV